MHRAVFAGRAAVVTELSLLTFLVLEEGTLTNFLGVSENVEN